VAVVFGFDAAKGQGVCTLTQYPPKCSKPSIYLALDQIVHFKCHIFSESFITRTQAHVASTYPPNG